MNIHSAKLNPPVRPSYRGDHVDTNNLPTLTRSIERDKTEFSAGCTLVDSRVCLAGHHEHVLAGDRRSRARGDGLRGAGRRLRGLYGPEREPSRAIMLVFVRCPNHYRQLPTPTPSPPPPSSLVSPCSPKLTWSR